MKKLLSVILSASMLLSSAAVLAEDANSSDKISVNMDGEQMVFDVDPVMDNDRVLVPFRAIFEKLGCNVSYSEEDGKQFVTAVRGDDSLTMEIGAYDMCMNGNVEAIDVPAKIKDGRTLVPVRAVSESFDARVEWLGSIKTVCIYRKHGLHRIETVTEERSVVDEKGTLIHISYAYPVIQNDDGDSYIGKINSEYKTNAEKFVNDALSNEEDARSLREYMGADFRPLEFGLSYKVNTDRKNILSITNFEYYNLGGAHPNTAKISRTFDLESKKELALSDLVNGNDDERRTMVYDVFVNELSEMYKEDFTAETASLINEEADNVRFYLTDDSLVLYFDVYQVGPYVMQYPTVELKYNEGVFKTDLSDANLDALEITLDGNPTTGYEWQVICADSDKLEVEEEYIPTPTSGDLVGVGGTYKFTVKGIGEGNASVDLAYMREWEGPNNAIDERTYKVYVSEDGKITVLGVESDLNNVKFGEMSEENTESVSEGGNFTNEMKMPITYDYNDYGANAVDRKGDHADSPYFSSVDFYNAQPTESLSILPKFKTIQQTSWWSCGVSSVEMVLNYYGKLGDWNEKTLADLRTDHSNIHKGTCLDQLIEMFDKVGGFKLETTYDYKDNLDAVNLEFIRQHIKDGVPVIVGWNDWGGHWQVIIGYDDMGTEYEGDDVIIVADSFDTTDHNQDGYGVYGAERFIYNFTFFDFFGDEGHLKDKCFVAAKPE